MTAAPAAPAPARRPPGEPGHRACGRVRRRAQARRARSWAAASPSSPATRMPSRPRSRSGLEGLADPEYLEGQRRIAPGIGAVIGVRWPLIEAVKRGFRDATKGERTSTWLFVADRLLREDGDGASLVRVRPARADDRRRDGAHVAARAAGRPRGLGVDHGRFARPRRRQGHPRRALSLGRARAARLLAVALGAPARRQHDRDDPVHRPPPRPRADRRRARPRPDRPADRRRRARRPEVAFLGPAQPRAWWTPRP